MRNSNSHEQVHQSIFHAKSMEGHTMLVKRRNVQKKRHQKAEETLTEQELRSDQRRTLSATQ